MPYTHLRSIVGLGLVAAHFAIIVLVGALTAAGRFTHDEMFMLVGIVAPLFAAYTTAIVRAVMNDPPARSDGPRMPTARTVLAISIPSVFVLIVAAGVIWKAFGALDFEGLVKLVGAAETLLGAYVGMVVERFFKPANGAQGS